MTAIRKLRTDLQNKCTGTGDSSADAVGDRTTGKQFTDFVTHAGQVNGLQTEPINLAIKIIDLGKTPFGEGQAARQVREDERLRLQTLFNAQRQGYISVIRRAMTEYGQLDDPYSYNEHRLNSHNYKVKDLKQEVKNFYAKHLTEFRGHTTSQLPQGSWRDGPNDTIVFANNFYGELPRPLLSLRWLTPQQRFEHWRAVLYQNGRDSAIKLVASMLSPCLRYVDLAATWENPNIRFYFSWLWASAADISLRLHCVPRIIVPKYIERVDDEGLRTALKI